MNHHRRWSYQMLFLWQLHARRFQNQRSLSMSHDCSQWHNSDVMWYVVNINSQTKIAFSLYQWMNDEIYATHNNLPHNQTAYTDCCERAKFTVNRASRARKMAPPTWAPAANALCSMHYAAVIRNTNFTKCGFSRNFRIRYWHMAHFGALWLWGCVITDL